MTSNKESIIRWDNTLDVVEDSLTLAGDMQFCNAYYDGGRNGQDITGMYGLREYNSYRVGLGYSSIDLDVDTSAGHYSAELRDYKLSPDYRTLLRQGPDYYDPVPVQRGEHYHDFSKKYSERASLLIARLVAKSVMREAKDELERRRKQLEDAEMVTARMYDMINAEAE